MPTDLKVTFRKGKLFFLQAQHLLLSIIVGNGLLCEKWKNFGQFYSVGVGKGYFKDFSYSNNKIEFKLLFSLIYLVLKAKCKDVQIMIRWNNLARFTYYWIWFRILIWNVSEGNDNRSPNSMPPRTPRWLWPWAFAPISCPIDSMSIVQHSI